MSRHVGSSFLSESLAVSRPPGRHVSLGTTAAALNTSCFRVKLGYSLDVLKDSPIASGPKRFARDMEWDRQGKSMRKFEVGMALHARHEDSSTSEDPDATFTVDDAIDSMGFGKFQFLLMVYAGIAWMGESMELMLLSFIGPSVRSSWNLSSTEESYLSSVVFIGMLIGAYSWGLISDAKGRRFGFASTALLTALCGFLSAFAPSYIWLLIFRALVGIGLGGAPVIFSLFMEFVPTIGRGFWLVAVAYFWTLGSIVESSLAWSVLPSLDWRWLVALSSLPLFLLLVLFPFLPESPRFHVVKGQPWKALHTLSLISSLNNKPLPKGKFEYIPSIGDNHVMSNDIKYEKKAEVSEKEDTIQNYALNSTSSSSVSPSISSSSPSSSTLSNNPFGVLNQLLSSSMRYYTLLLWTVFFSNAFSYYGMVLLTSTLLSPENCSESLVTSENRMLDLQNSNEFFKSILITSCAELPGLMVANLLIDRIGRKNSMYLLLFSTILFLIPLYFQLPSSLLLLSLFGSRASIMGSFQILFIYAPEVYPTNIRSSGLGIANSFSRLGGILCPFVSVYLVSSCEKTLAITLFVCVIFVAILAIHFFPVETMDRRLKNFSGDMEEEGA